MHTWKRGRWFDADEILAPNSPLQGPNPTKILRINLTATRDSNVVSHIRNSCTQRICYLINILVLSANHKRKMEIEKEKWEIQRATKSPTTVSHHRRCTDFDIFVFTLLSLFFFPVINKNQIYVIYIKF